MRTAAQTGFGIDKLLARGGLDGMETLEQVHFNRIFIVKVRPILE
jgi:hypothetical protein